MRTTKDRLRIPGDLSVIFWISGSWTRHLTFVANQGPRKGFDRDEGGGGTKPTSCNSVFGSSQTWLFKPGCLQFLRGTLDGGNSALVIGF